MQSNEIVIGVSWRMHLRCNDISLGTSWKPTKQKNEYLRIRHWAYVFFILILAVVAAPFAHAADATADQVEVNGNLTVAPIGVSLQGYNNAGAGLSVGGLFISGYQVDASGVILNGTGVQNGDDASFYSLTTGGMAVGGGLSIGGNLFIQNQLSIGSWWDGSAAHGGVAVTFFDDHNANSSQIYFTGAAPQTVWSWSPSQGLVTLEPNGNLSLTDNLSGNTVTLVPGNFSFVLSHNSTILAAVPFSSINAASTVFASDGTITLGGGNIVLDGASSAPTVNLGNYSLGLNNSGSAWMLSSASSGKTIVLNTADAELIFSNGFSLGGDNTQAWIGLSNLGLAFGSNTSAGAARAVAMGGQANASGVGALALSSGTASGNGSLALGNGSLASGSSSAAMAGGQATGNASLALGVGTVTQTWGAIATGHNNAPVSGNATAWSSEDAAFVVGSGANSAAPANAMVIYNNGNITMSGNTTLTDASHQLQVNGASTFNGTVTFGGNVALPQPLGDVPMGPFGNH